MPGQRGYSERQVDGVAHYRVDGLDVRVLVSPATCRRGHDIVAARYRAREAKTDPVANVAELDDAPYWRLVTPC